MKYYVVWNPLAISLFLPLGKTGKYYHDLLTAEKAVGQSLSSTIASDDIQSLLSVIKKETGCALVCKEIDGVSYDRTR